MCAIASHLVFHLIHVVLWETNSFYMKYYVDSHLIHHWMGCGCGFGSSEVHNPSNSEWGVNWHDVLCKISSPNISHSCAKKNKKSAPVCTKFIPNSYISWNAKYCTYLKRAGPPLSVGRLAGAPAKKFKNQNYKINKN